MNLISLIDSLEQLGLEPEKVLQAVKNYAVAEEERKLDARKRDRVRKREERRRKNQEKKELVEKSLNRKNLINQCLRPADISDAQDMRDNTDKALLDEKTVINQWLRPVDISDSLDSLDNLDKVSSQGSLSPEPPFSPNSPSKEKPPKGVKKKSSPSLKNYSKIPEWIEQENLIDAWNGFVAMRQRIKKPMTERAAKMAVKKLQEFKKQGFSPQEILEQSEFNEYQDLYQPKQNKNYDRKETQAKAGEGNGGGDSQPSGNAGNFGIYARKASTGEQIEAGIAEIARKCGASNC